MKRNAFGQLGIGFAPAFHRPFLRYFAPVDGGGQGGSGSGDGDGSGDGGKGGDDGGDADRKFTQEDVDRIVADRLARASRPKSDGQPKPKDDDARTSGKPEGEQPTGVSADDVQKRIDDALAAERKELALERVTDQLEKALDGRTYAASKLFALDRSQFIGEDGKTVATAKLQKWVDDNSEEGAAPSRRLRAQGTRDANASGGSVSAGRDLYDDTHKKKSGKD